MPVKKESSVKSQYALLPKAKVKSRATKKTARAVKKTVLESAVKKTAASHKSVNLSVPVYSLAGNETGTLTLPKEIFGQKVNKGLLAQAARVYLTNQKSLNASTKTRGEVVGSTAKIYRQKGTGRARHGAVRAPIFVGGGIVFGPKPRKVRLDLPKKMKKAALIAALSDKAAEKNTIGLSGLDKASGKTKEMADLLKKLLAISYWQLAAKSQKLKAKSVLIVTEEKQDNVVRAARNIPGINVLPVNLINAYEVLKHNLLLITKEAVEKMGAKK